MANPKEAEMGFAHCSGGVWGRAPLKKVAFIFPGQGAQVVGMGKDFYSDNFPRAKKVYEALGDDARELLFNGEQDDLNKTINAQPCLFATELATAYALIDAGVTPQAVAGFSLGEMTALVIAGLVPETSAALDLVNFRARLMQAATEKQSGGMAAVMGLSNEDVINLCEKVDGVTPANFTAPGQVVVSFAETAKEEFIEAAKAVRAKVIPLKVSGAFHSPLMDSAAKGFAEYLNIVKFDKPKMPIYSNVTGKPYGGDSADLIARQINSPVRWQAVIENMIADGYDTFIEVGPGKTLAGMIKRINKEAIVYNVYDGLSLEAVKNEIG